MSGGTSLSGRVRVTGAKNSALKLMAAALLAPGRTTIDEVPDILDVSIMSEVLRRLGCGDPYPAGQRRSTGHLEALHPNTLRPGPGTLRPAALRCTA